ncbi:MAG: recombination regulator RecX [Proteobacteria bacterium]|jgi:regulatory protein|nr:recombination regulator RecX [Pseudomonadota bacterium]
MRKSGSDTEYNTPSADTKPRKATRPVRETAMGLLANREHSTRQLQDKLLARGYSSEEVAEALQTLTRDGLLSDARFVEAFVYSRRQRGSGPLKIRAELHQRGVDDELIDAWLDERDPDWLTRAEAARCKKFGPALPVDFRDKARQARFLQYRGFSADQTRQVLRDED